MPNNEDYDAGDWDDENDEFEGFEIDDGLDIGFEHESDEIWPLLEKFGLISHDDHADVDEEPQLPGKHDPRWEIKLFPLSVIHACEENLLSKPASRVGRGPFRCPVCNSKISENEVEEIVDEALARRRKHDPFSRLQERTNINKKQPSRPASPSRNPKKAGSTTEPEISKPGPKNKKAEVPEKQTTQPSKTDEESTIPVGSEAESPRNDATPAGSSQGREERFARLLQAAGHSVGLGRIENANDEHRQIQRASPDDPLLHYLLWLAEVGTISSITVNMSGLLLSGQLVGANKFFSVLEELYKKASGDKSERKGILAIQRVFAEQAQAEYDKAAKSLRRMVLAARTGRELPDIEPPLFIHLLDITIEIGDELVTLPAWRGRVSAIDGFTPGHLTLKNDDK